MILTPRDWQAIAQREAFDLLGTPEGAAKLAEANRYGALADVIEQQHRDIERLSAGVKIRIPTDTMEQEIAAHTRRAVAVERERCVGAIQRLIDGGLNCHAADCIEAIRLRGAAL